MLDTGSNITLMDKSTEPFLQQSHPSHYTIQVANNQSMQGSRDGKLTLNVVKTGARDPVSTQISKQVTTVSNLNKQLFSVDELYRAGYSILLRHPSYGCGIAEIYKQATDYPPEPAVSIPVRYDWENSGFWIDFHLENKYTNHVMQQLYTDEQADTITKYAWAMQAVVEVSYGQHAEERSIRGVKAGLRQRKQKMTAKEFHEEYAHLGSQPDCHICKLTKGSMRRIYKVVDKHREQRPAHTWVMDGVVWSQRSLSGSKYMVTLRCKATGMFKNLYLYLRSDITEHVRDWILEMRADPAYHGLPYQAVSYIETDQAGEWGRKCATWSALEKELQFKTIYKPADRKEEAGAAERACGIMEVTTKAGLMERGLPPSWWQRCAEQAVWLLNRFPVTSQDISVPIDDDRARPLELCTRGFYSRRQIDRELNYFISVGSPALVHDVKAKGSTLGPKSQWGIAIGMYRESVEFWNPFSRSTRLSKSFTAFKLRNNMSFYQFLQLPAMPKTQREAALPSDLTERVVVQLPQLQTSQNQLALPPVTQVKVANLPAITAGHQVDQAQAIEASGDKQPVPPATTQAESMNQQKLAVLPGILDPVAAVESSPAANTPVHSAEQSNTQTLSDAVPTVTVLPKLGRELRGSVQILDSNGQQLATDTETGALQSAPVGTETVVESDIRSSKPALNHKLSSKPKAKQAVVVLRCSKQEQQLWDEAETRRASNQTITTGAHDTFIKVCKAHKLPHEKHHLYRQWITQTQHHPNGGKLSLSDLPTKRGQKLPPHLKLPKPTGKLWRTICSKRQVSEDSSQGEIEHLIEQAKGEIKAELQAQKHSYRCTGTYKFDHKPVSAHAARKKKRRRAGNTGEPANTREALEGENGLQWAESMDEEINGLTKMGVLDHGYTLRQLREMGITSKPVPLGLYYQHKLGKHGEITRLKTRAAVQGHPGNMQKGIHYTHTFASTPSEDTQRFLCCITILLNLKRRACDVEKAYCWADLPPGELIALSYPDGYKRTNEAGEPLFMLMRKNLYGHPAAAAAWERERNGKLLSIFNGNGWTCQRAAMDPCLFQFTDPRGKQAWTLIHTDDIDAAGEDDEILDAIFKQLHSTWSIKETDSEYMLGVTRKLTRNSQTGTVQSIECTMTPYIRGAAQAFQQHLLNTAVHVPYPEKVKVSKLDQPDDTEVGEVIALGYQRAVGLILWAARHCYPECKYGISQLCSVMARPSYKAFSAAMHMLTYLSQNDQRGIKFTADGNKLPIACSDASNKPDPADGLAQAGFVITWLGGPLAFNSKKLKHIGLSSEHNEYMGLTAATKRVIWLRQLISDLGVAPSVLQHPTLILGDNTQANRLTREHFITTGNQYIYLPYHFTREASDLGHIAVKWLPTKENVADLFTKPVNRQTFQALLGALTGYSSVQHFEDLLLRMQ